MPGLHSTEAESAIVPSTKLHTIVNVPGESEISTVADPSGFKLPMEVPGPVSSQLGNGCAPTPFEAQLRDTETRVLQSTILGFAHMLIVGVICVEHSAFG